MAGKAKFVFIASMDVEPAKEALFNEVYDTEHVPLLLKVPGVLAATRVKTEPLTMIIGGERKTSVVEGEPRYSAIYELESAEVLVSDAWAKAVDQGCTVYARRGCISRSLAMTTASCRAASTSRPRPIKCAGILGRCRSGKPISSPGS